MAKRSNAEFQQETDERLAKHEELLEGILAELKNLSSSGAHTGPHAGTLATTNKPYLKLHFPRFDGGDPAGWLYQAEQYFEFQRVDDADKVHLASFHLDGVALQWHRWLSKSTGPMTWIEFSRALQGRFGPTDYNDLAEAITRLKQNSTVVLYQEEFERLSHRLDGLPEPFLVGCFIGGLKDEIRIEVRLKNPKSLTSAISLARLVEEKLYIAKRPGFSTSSLTAPTFRKATSTPSTGLLGPGPNQFMPIPVSKRFSFRVQPQGVRMAEWSKAPDSSSGLREGAWVQIPLLTFFFARSHANCQRLINEVIIKFAQISEKVNGFKDDTSSISDSDDDDKITAMKSESDPYSGNTAFVVKRPNLHQQPIDKGSVMKNQLNEEACIEGKILSETTRMKIGYNDTVDNTRRTPALLFDQGDHEEPCNDDQDDREDSSVEGLRILVNDFNLDKDEKPIETRKEK
ncbi:hypothetical protein E3N88_30566 [Mikania micrantha]|uniref:Ty3 transposon capsid-like protein domain-containing protein n=1 Tax=Mikania micrantha TaxID=192012 RepID=A0A5N6MMR5_9ASTR|nr:hypothetical protein E3N88_30566 [Mikania micrantha]